MTNTKHTPTPWHYVENKRLGLMQICDTIYHNKGETSLITSINTNDPHLHNAQANAAYIVKAVNCHEQLVEALKALRNAARKQGYEFGSVSGQVRAALAAAESN